MNHFSVEVLCFCGIRITSPPGTPETTHELKKVYAVGNDLNYPRTDFIIVLEHNRNGRLEGVIVDEPSHERLASKIFVYRFASTKRWCSLGRLRLNQKLSWMYQTHRVCLRISWYLFSDWKYLRLLITADTFTSPNYRQQTFKLFWSWIV